MATLNFNIGVLGHVDSGKTSLSKALSTVASTACFDKNPQSKQRGITLDLGFSSFTIQSPASLQDKGYEFVQYTLVDCPGHASLIKTIIGGAQIIDMMMLVIDVVKGMQTQTAECLIIGEICCDKLLIVLNKLDLIEESKRKATVEKMSKRLLKTLEGTKFADSPVVAVSANRQQEAECTTNEPSMINIDVLIDTLKTNTFLPDRSSTGPFLFSVDHCFSIKGQGTIMTGTVLNGSVKINDTVEIPIFKLQKKVKSIQIFRKPVEHAVQGDRCGICFTSFDAKQFERGILCQPNYSRPAYAAIISLNKIRHFKGTIHSGSKFHITIGHETLIAKIDLFTENNEASSDKRTSNDFDFRKEYIYVEECDAEKNSQTKMYALVDFSSESDAYSVLCVPNSLLIGSKLDIDIHLNQCRIAFHGRALHLFFNKDFKDNSKIPAGSDYMYLNNLRVFKRKSREGFIERKHDESVVIGKGLFKKETNMELFNGLKVVLSTGESGIIDGSFGQSGKFKVRIQGGLLKSTIEQLDGANPRLKKKQTVRSEEDGQDGNISTGHIKIFLEFKKFIYDDKGKISQ